MSEEELEGKIVTGVYVNNPRIEFIESMEKIITEHSDINPDDNIRKAYMSD